MIHFIVCVVWKKELGLSRVNRGPKVYSPTPDTREGVGFNAFLGPSGDPSSTSFATRGSRRGRLPSCLGPRPRPPPRR